MSISVEWVTVLDGVVTINHIHTYKNNDSEQTP